MPRPLIVFWSRRCWIRSVPISFLFFIHAIGSLTVYLLDSFKSFRRVITRWQLTKEMLLVFNKHVHSSFSTFSSFISWWWWKSCQEFFMVYQLPRRYSLTPTDRWSHIISRENFVWGRQCGKTLQKPLCVRHVDWCITDRLRRLKQAIHLVD